MIQWESHHYEKFPWRETDNKFHALIAELMLQRTKAEQVVPVYNKFTSRYPNLEAIIDADEDEIINILSSLGLNWRIQKIIDLLEILTKEGKIPEDYDVLVELPGIGDYIASAFLSFHYGQYWPIIDSNAVRLWGRILNIETEPETRRKKWFKKIVKEITPEKNVGCFNYGVLDLTRSTCKSKPLCNNCPLTEICGYFQRVKNGGRGGLASYTQ